MEFPKKIMYQKELVQMGFPEKMLRRISREKGQKVAYRSIQITGQAQPCLTPMSCRNISSGRTGRQSWQGKGGV